MNETAERMNETWEPERNRKRVQELTFRIGEYMETRPQSPLHASAGAVCRQAAGEKAPARLSGRSLQAGSGELSILTELK